MKDPFTNLNDPYIFWACFPQFSTNALDAPTWRHGATSQGETRICKVYDSSGAEKKMTADGPSETPEIKLDDPTGGRNPKKSGVQ